MSTATLSYKRMVLLPENEYTLLKQYRLPNTDVVWPNESSTEREQKLYALKLRENREADDSDNRDSASLPTPKTSFTAEINHFPKPFQSRAKRLLAFLEEHRPLISWNKEGEVSFGPHGSPFSNSKLTDLIYHATAVTRRNFQPTAWSDFVGALKELNVPSTALSNATLKEMQQPPQPMTTPKRRRRRQVLATPRNWVSIR